MAQDKFRPRSSLNIDQITGRVRDPSLEQALDESIVHIPSSPLSQTKVERLANLAARDNTVIDNPYQ